MASERPIWRRNKMAHAKCGTLWIASETLPVPLQRFFWPNVATEISHERNQRRPCQEELSGRRFACADLVLHSPTKAHCFETPSPRHICMDHSFLAPTIDKNQLDIECNWLWFAEFTHEHEKRTQPSRWHHDRATSAVFAFSEYHAFPMLATRETDPANLFSF